MKLPTNPASPLEAALELSSQGIRVFPCNPKTKTPLISHWQTNATSDRKSITDFWTRFPSAMIGMPTGKINGVFVVDLDYDKEKGIDGRLALSQLLPVHLQTTSVLTPRGGHHYYFKMSVNVKVRNSAGQIGPGIDIRGDGGYVVVPPSTRFDGASYSWIEPLTALAPPPQELLNLLNSRPDKTRQKICNTKMQEVLPVMEAQLIKAANVLGKSAAGGRNHQLNRTAFLAGKSGHNLAATEKLLTAACQRNGLLEEDGYDSILATIRRSHNDGRNAGYERDENSETNELLEVLNRDFFVASVGSSTCVVSFETMGDDFKRPVFRTFEAFQQLYSNKRVISEGRSVPAGKWWLSHSERRQYKGIRFLPKGPAILEDGSFNTWQGFAYHPTTGNCDLILNHIRTVLANEDEAAAHYILNYLAWTVQNPDKPAEVALVFIGGEGTGKGLIGRLMAELFGSAGLQISSARHLTGNFNGHLDSVCLLFADEAYWAGDKSARGSLFGLITEPTLVIEQKGIDARRTQNRLHIIMASNESWVVPAAGDSRRFAVFRVNEKHKQEKNYFEPLFAQVENGGRAAFLNHLLTHEVGDFHPRRIIRTRAFQEQILMSLDPVASAVLELLEAGELPYGAKGMLSNFVPASSPYGNERFFDRLRRGDQSARYLTDRQIAERLRHFGCRQHRLKGVIRGWLFPQLSEARAAWDANYGPYEWSDDETDWAAHKGDDSPY